LPLPLGVLGHEGSTVIVGLNALRLLSASAWPHATAVITPGEPAVFSGQEVSSYGKPAGAPHIARTDVDVSVWAFWCDRSRWCRAVGETGWGSQRPNMTRGARDE
jgi:hypothetical protein